MSPVFKFKVDLAWQSSEVGAMVRAGGATAIAIGTQCPNKMPITVNLHHHRDIFGTHCAIWLKGCLAFGSVYLLCHGNRKRLHIFRWLCPEAMYQVRLSVINGP